MSLNKPEKITYCELTLDTESRIRESNQFYKDLVDSVFEIVKQLYSIEKEIEAIFPPEDFDITFLSKEAVSVYDLIKENEGKEGYLDIKEALIKHALNLNLLKTYKSTYEKFDRRKDWVPNVLPDLIRFSIVCKKPMRELGGVKNVLYKFSELTKLLEKNGFKKSKFAPRILDTGYCDIQSNFETPPTEIYGISFKTSLEIQIHELGMLEAKELETPIYDERKLVANKIFSILKSPLDQKQFVKKLDRFVVSIYNANKPLTDLSIINFLRSVKNSFDVRDLRLITEDLRVELKNYLNLFEKSKDIFDKTNPFLNSQKEVENYTQVLEDLLTINIEEPVFDSNSLNEYTQSR